MKNFAYLLILGAVILFKSCAPAYIPNVVNTPMLGDRGEFQAAVYTGSSGFDAQAAFAITDNVGLMLNGSFADRTSDSTDNFHKHQFVEFAPGYHTKLGQSGRFETFLGFGTGKINALYGAGLWDSRSNVNYNRIFLQPAIGTATDYFDGSFAMRFVYVDLFQEDKSNYGLFFEPVVTAKLGYKYVKAVAQFGFSIPINGDHVQFNYQPFIFSLGLQGTFGRK
jgi:hypothetical protein